MDIDEGLAYGEAALSVNGMSTKFYLGHSEEEGDNQYTGGVYCAMLGYKYGAVGRMTVLYTFS